jgi:hypothetical protein
MKPAAPGYQRLLRAVAAIAWRGAPAPVLLLVAHFIALKYSQVYLLYPWLDLPVHLVGGFLMMRLLWCGIDRFEEHALLEPSRGRLRQLLMFSLAATGTLLWELTELFILYAKMGKWWHTAPDTLADIFYGMCGASAYLVLCAFRRN